MIISKLQGGLGNQIFQWAFGRHLSNLNNIPLYLDSDFYKSDILGVTKRDFSLNKFPYLNYKLTDVLEKNGKQFLRFFEQPVFEKLEYNISYNYYLDGYFQSEKYFMESSNLIREELKPNNEFLQKINHLLNKKTVSLHIRRTDYLNSNGYHPVQPIEYYQKALDIIGNYDNLLVFSDDINWCKNNLYFDNMIFIDGNDDVEDLWLMSLCKNNIIANSSFSWWGAWLNNNPDKKVIAPNNWFGSQTNLNTTGIIPNSWIKI